MTSASNRSITTPRGRANARRCWVCLAVPDDELLHRLGDLVSQSRRVEADVVAHIGEVDQRRLFARFAVPSMFAYCTERLHLSEAEAYRRITVARAARRYPTVLSALQDGRITLSGLATIVPLLTGDNCEQLLERATHRTKRQIEELVAELAPRPDAAGRIRRLPEPSALLGVERVAAVQLVPGRVGFPAGTERAPLPSNVVPVVSNAAPRPATSHSSPVAESAPAVVKALSPGRYKVQFTAGAELRDKLERLTALLRSEIPDGSLAAVVERAVSGELERLEARRFGRTRSPRRAPTDAKPSSSSRQIPSAVRRAVADRDQDRCRFIDEQGRRCTERHQLQFHHRHPFGMGGQDRAIDEAERPTRTSSALAEARSRDSVRERGAGSTRLG